MKEIENKIQKSIKLYEEKLSKCNAMYDFLWNAEKPLPPVGQRSLGYSLGKIDLYESVIADLKGLLNKKEM